MMSLISGIAYNYKGLKLGLKTPKLLFLGLVRFVVIVMIAIVSAGLILSYHNEILSLIWAKPESSWIIWLWHVVSWLLTLLLMGISAVVSFLISQVLFSVIRRLRGPYVTDPAPAGQQALDKARGTEPRAYGKERGEDRGAMGIGFGARVRPSFQRMGCTLTKSADT